ncbi:hypothetical protein ATANTOWER_023672 [Ataeniobius toweri]|uniref:Uncharacterized protein n=1 Tax=Ataeniobius toweri TaxID=208326 RepID=A0ABU7AK05_9TELE|nr:hypothetical protein [Ataeniobius toweri]
MVFGPGFPYEERRSLEVNKLVEPALSHAMLGHKAPGDAATHYREPGMEERRREEEEEEKVSYKAGRETFNMKPRHFTKAKSAL